MGRLQSFIDNFYYSTNIKEGDNLLWFFSNKTSYFTDGVQFTRIPNARPYPEIMLNSTVYPLLDGVTIYCEKEFCELMEEFELPFHVCGCCGKPFIEGYTIQTIRKLQEGHQIRCNNEFEALTTDYVCTFKEAGEIIEKLYGLNCAYDFIKSGLSKLSMNKFNPNDDRIISVFKTTWDKRNISRAYSKMKERMVNSTWEKEERRNTQFASFLNLQHQRL